MRKPGAGSGAWTKFDEPCVLGILQRNTRTTMTETQPQIITLPTTFEEFLRFEPTDG